MNVFGRPFSCKLKRPPERILELICGQAAWSLHCDQFLKGLGYPDVSFTGVDIAPLAPDLNKYGVKWNFVQHDVRRPPLPFGEDFDLIMVNDGTTVLQSAKDVQSNPIITLQKYLRPGGCVEVVETDYVFRCLQPDPARPPGLATRDVDQANKTATYTVGPATSFSKSASPFIGDYNKWVEKIFFDREFTTTPCATMSYVLATETSGYEEYGSRRVAVPFGNIRWEDDVESMDPSGDGSTQVPPSGRKKGKGKGLTKDLSSLKEHEALTPEQAAIRSTALTVVLGLMEAMETTLKKESGKKQDEWDRWWAAMMEDLVLKNRSINGECLEAGVWWARKESAPEEEETDSDDTQDE